MRLHNHFKMYSQIFLVLGLLAALVKISVSEEIDRWTFSKLSNDETEFPNVHSNRRPFKVHGGNPSVVDDMGLLSLPGDGTFLRAPDPHGLPSNASVGFWMKHGGFHSHILGTENKYHEKLDEWLSPYFQSNSSKWTRCFRAAEENWDASKLNNNCNNKGPIVMIVRVGQLIFGGFLSTSLTGSGYVKDSSAFIFSLKNANDLAPFKCNVRPDKWAVRSNDGHFPSFGDGDISLFSIENSSSSNLGNTYDVNDIDISDEDKMKVLAGAHYFRPQDLEIFYRQPLYPKESEGIKQNRDRRTVTLSLRSWTKNSDQQSGSSYIKINNEMHVYGTSEQTGLNIIAISRETGEIFTLPSMVHHIQSPFKQQIDQLPPRVVIIAVGQNNYRKDGFGPLDTSNFGLDDYVNSNEELFGYEPYSYALIATKKTDSEPIFYKNVSTTGIASLEAQLVLDVSTYVLSSGGDSMESTGIAMFRVSARPDSSRWLIQLARETQVTRLELPGIPVGWLHVFLTWSEVNGLRYYENGVLKLDGTIKEHTPSNRSSPLGEIMIGRGVAGYNLTINTNMAMYGLTLFNNELSAEQVMDHVNTIYLTPVNATIANYSKDSPGWHTKDDGSMSMPGGYPKGTKFQSISIALLPTYNCVSFKYRLHGEGIGRLNVYKAQISTAHIDMIWFKTGNQGRNSDFVQLNVNSSHPFKIGFEAISGGSFHGSITITQVKASTNASCVDLPQTPPMAHAVFPSAIIAHLPEYTKNLNGWLTEQGFGNKVWSRCQHTVSSAAPNRDAMMSCMSSSPVIVLKRNNDIVSGAFFDNYELFREAKSSSRSCSTSTKAFNFTFPDNVTLIKSDCALRLGDQMISFEDYQFSLEPDQLISESEMLYLNGSACTSNLRSGQQCDEITGKIVCDPSQRDVEWCRIGKHLSTSNITADAVLYFPLDDPHALKNLRAPMWARTPTDTSQCYDPIQGGCVSMKNPFRTQMINTCGKQMWLGCNLAVSFWLNFPSISPSGQKYVEITHPPHSFYDPFIRIFHLSEEGKNFAVEIKNDSNLVCQYVFFLLPAIWNHIVFTLEGYGKISLFLNGIESSYDQKPCKPRSDQGSYSSSFEDSVSSYSIDELVVWERRLDAKEVIELYDYYKGLPDLTAVWMMLLKDVPWNDRYYQPSSNESVELEKTLGDNLDGYPVDNPVTNWTIEAITAAAGMTSVTLKLRFSGRDIPKTFVDIPNISKLNTLNVMTETLSFNDVITAAIKLHSPSKNSISVHLQWEQPTNKPTRFRGIFQGYLISYYPVLLEGEELAILNTTLRGAITSFNVTGLLPGTNYSFTVRPMTLEGLGTIETVTVMTSDIPPGVAPNSVSVTNVSVGVVLVEWSAIDPVHILGSPLSKYEVVWSDPSSSELISMAKTRPDVTNFTISGLKNFTRYSVVVRGVNTIAGPVSDTTYFYTMHGVPEAPVIGLVDATKNCIYLSWQEIPESQRYGILAGYMVEVNVSHPGGNRVLMVRCLQAELCNLTAFTLFEVTVSAFTPAGRGPGNSRVQRTGEDAPGVAPNSVSVTNVSVGVVLVEWSAIDPVHILGSPLSKYEVVWSDPSSSELISMAKTRPDVTNFTISGLNNFTRYSVVVRGVNTIAGPDSDTTYFYTMHGFPEAPVIELVDATTNCIYLSWQEVPESQRYGIVAGYIVEVNVSDPGENRVLMVSCLQAKLCNLTAFTLFEVTVSAFTPSGHGPGNSRVQRTGEDVPTGVPSNLNITNVGKHNCSLSWEEIPVLERRGVISHIVMFWPDGDSDNHRTAAVGSSTNATLCELEPNANYSIAIAGSNSKGMGNFSTPVRCQTQASVPYEVPQYVNAGNTSSTSCLVEWGNFSLLDRGGQVHMYSIIYLDGGMPRTWGNVTGGVTRAHVEGLDKWTDYYFAVQAINSEGRGPFTDPKAGYCKTDEDVPSNAPNILSVTPHARKCVVSWSMDGMQANGNVTHYTVTYSGASLPENSSIVHDQTEVTIESLKPYRDYNITISASTSKGEGPGANVTCTTLQDAPDLPPQNITFISATSTSLSFGWSPVPLEYRNGEVTEYIYQVHNGGAIGRTSEMQVTVDGLSPWTNYTFKVLAKTNKEGDFSEPVTAQTGEGAPTVGPEGLSGYSLSSFSIFANWSAMDAKDVPGILRGYVLFYKNMNITDASTKNVTVDSSTTEYTLEGLSLYSKYKIEVAAVTVAVGEKSQPIYVFTSSKDLPPPDVIPEFVVPTNISSTGLLVQWNPTTNNHPDPDASITGYRVYYKRAGSDEEMSVFASGQDTSSIRLTNLAKFSDYSVRIVAVNLFGEGNKTQAYEFKTAEDAPSEPPANVTVKAVSKNSIVLAWEPIPKEGRNGIVDGYKIKYFKTKEGEDTAKYVDVKEPSRSRRAVQYDPEGNTLTGLDAFSEYAVQVMGYTVADGVLSPVMYVNTSQTSPSAPPVNITAFNTSATSIRVLWSNVPEAHRNGIIQNFVFSYGETALPWSNHSNITLTLDSLATTAEGYFTKDLTGLKIWTLYSIRILAFTVGDGPFNAPVVTRTDEFQPCAPPDDIRFDVVSPWSVIVIWDQVPEKCRNGIILGYKLLHGQLNGSEILQQLPNITTDANTRRVELKNLAVSSSYRVMLLAFNSKGESPLSSDTMYSDTIGLQVAPGNITVESFVTISSIVVSWDPVQLKSKFDTLMGYRLTYTPLTIGKQAVKHAVPRHVTVRKDTLRKTITGLEMFGKYRVEVSGFTRFGDGPKGAADGETCRCEQRLTTNYRMFPPYVDKDFSGIIRPILNDLAVRCCHVCQSHGHSQVDFVTNSNGGPAMQPSDQAVKSLIGNASDLSFPIYGWNWQTYYSGAYRYIPLIDSPGFAYIVLQPVPENTGQRIVNSLLATWPYMLITMLITLLAGMLIWFLDTASNSQQFPHSFVGGIGNGFWWAFVTMTTLGYGDRVPCSFRAKLFSIVWVMLGLVIWGIMNGAVCTALTVMVFEASTSLYGTKVAVIKDTPEFRFALRKNAKVPTDLNFTNFDQVLAAVTSGQVRGMILDAFEAGSRKKKLEAAGPRIRVQRVYDYKSTYGIVLSRNSTRLYQCARGFMQENRAAMFARVENLTDALKGKAMVSDAEEFSTGLFDAQSPVFRALLKYSLYCLGGAVALGLLWELYLRLQEHRAKGAPLSINRD
ncbi:uncharacterized protein LOC116616082 isoform X2 [Nematostella vectensis]|uniref:uncharacterized protein LOC116616082 isoform X2 n=1 Tax=Nematostella vectensis TaxID=45351 RepID=UPI0020776A00|nr:uncharacterized protein LOC116616082 isoform X2 [Nematostella vectensis]